MGDDQKNETDPTQVSLEDTGIIDLPRVDVTEYVGKKSKIELVTEHKGQNKFRGGDSFYVKFVTEPMGVLHDENGHEVVDKDSKAPIQATGSRIISLGVDKDGKVGWGESSKMSEFLKKYDVKHYKDMIGKEVLVQGRDKDGKTFLTIA